MGLDPAEGLALAQLLVDRLDLALPPVAMAFVESEPDGVAPLGKDPPSFCTLWRWAEERPMYVTAGAAHGMRDRRHGGWLRV